MIADVRAVGSLMGYRLEFIPNPDTGKIDKKALVLLKEDTKLAEGFRTEDGGLSLTPFLEGAPLSWDEADFELDEVVSDFRQMLVTAESYGLIDSRGSSVEAIRLSGDEGEEEQELVDSRTNPIESLRHSTSGALQGYMELLLLIDSMGAAYQARLKEQGGKGGVAVGLFGFSWFTFYGSEYPSSVYADGTMQDDTASAYLAIRRHELHNSKTKGPLHAVASLEGEFDWVLTLSDLIDLFTPGYEGADQT